MSLCPPLFVESTFFFHIFFFETLPYYYSQLIFHQRDAKTLEAIIKKRVRPGTHILTDCWPAYSKLDQLEGFNLIWHHKDFFLYPLSFILYFFLLYIGYFRLQLHPRHSQPQWAFQRSYLGGSYKYCGGKVPEYISIFLELLFSCPEQLNRWPCHSLTDSLRTLLIVTQKTIQLTSDFPDIWSEWWGDMSWPTKRQRQRHIQQRHHLRIWDFENRQITARNHHDLANIGWNNLKIMTVAILETCDLYDIWSEW